MKNVRFLCTLENNLKNQSVNNVYDYLELAMKYRALDLGLAFPNFVPFNLPIHCLQEVVRRPVSHQYCNLMGNYKLRKIISDFYMPHLNIKLNPKSEILIQSAYTLIFTTVHSFIKKGDEVIIIEPFFNTYEEAVKSSGGICKYYQLELEREESLSWKCDVNKLSHLITDKTRMLFINNPHNPTGKVFNEAELRDIADLCNNHDIICLCDEVSEFLVYPPAKHIRMCTLPGMWEKTITISSSGKTFGVTGWRVGWAYGHEQLMSKIILTHKFLVGPHNTPMQKALTTLLNKYLRETKDYIEAAKKSLKIDRDYITNAFNRVGLECIKPDGGFVFLANIENYAKKADLSKETDAYLDSRLAKWMIKEKRILAMPGTMFYTNDSKAKYQNFIRICFWKTNSTLHKAPSLLTENPKITIN